MKKLLTFLICILSASGIFATKLEITAKLNIAGAGTVTLQDKNSRDNKKTIQSNIGESLTAESYGGFYGLGKHSAKIEVSVTESNSEYYFTGWELPQQLSNKSGTKWTYEVAHGATDESYTIIAQFKPYWTTEVIAIMASKGDNGTVKTTVGQVKAACHGATDITHSLETGTLDAKDFTVETSSNTDTEGNTIFKITYLGNQSLSDIVGKYVYLTLTSGNNKTQKVQVGVIEAPTLTFKATDKGTYTVESLIADWNGTGQDKEMLINNPVLLTEVPITLTSDPKDGYIFWGWQIEEEEKNPELLKDISIKKTFMKSATITPIFVPNTGGFMVMNDNGTQEKNYPEDLSEVFNIYEYWAYSMQPQSIHYDLQEALDIASSNQFVVFDNLATIFSKFGITRSSLFEQPYAETECVLPNRTDGYTVPEGVTLLIPADAKYAYGMHKMDRRCYQAESGLSIYRKLIIAENTTITVNGTLCIFAYLTSTSGIPGSPNACGVIEMKDGAHIQVNGSLYSYGYIINPTNTSITTSNINTVGKITASSTAKIFETFQMADWRGGNATSTMLKNEKLVFPINQYYIQNIEVPITFYRGSTESLSTAVDITAMGTLVAEAKFILPNTSSESGFFKLGDGTSVTKYYDAQQDRLHFIVNGSALNSQASIENVYLPISGYEVNSTDYVLAVTNNMDISLNNVTLNFKYDLCLLPGATVQIDKTAKVLIDGTSNNPASVYVYDEEWKSRNGIGTGTGDGGGYFGSSNAQIVQATKRPGGIKSRTISEDASIVVDGLLEVGQYGELYTTDKGTLVISGGTFGANITSNQNGRVKITNVGNNSTTYQAIQTDNAISDWLPIPVTSAKLKNADDTFVSTTIDDKGKIYVYDGNKWTLPTWTLPNLTVTLPTEEIGNQKVGLAITDLEKDENQWIVTISSGSGFSIDGTNNTTTITYSESMGNNIEFPIYYKAQNKNGTHSANITVTHNSDTYTTTINAIENYKPIFSTTPTPPEVLNLGEMFIGDHSIPVGSVVIPTTGNVTSLITNDTYVSRLSWEVVSNSNEEEFKFKFGEGKKALNDAKITFTPTSSGSKEATIKLTATYKDVNNVDVVSDEVTLLVTAIAKDLLPNEFALTSDCQNELKNMCANIPLTLEFDKPTSNTKPLKLEFESNGEEGNPVLTYTGNGKTDNPFVVTATRVPEPEVMPKFKITQESDGIYKSYTTDFYETSVKDCAPMVTWDWSDLYFGESFTNPVVSNSDGLVTLTLTKLETKDGTEITDNAEIQEIINYNSTDKTATIGGGLEGEYIATFSFVQAQGTSHSAYTETFISAIYARPNLLDLCVDSERVFKGVQSGSSSAYFEEDNKVVFPVDASWTMSFVGVPDILKFTPTANTQLMVLESPDGTSWTTAYYAMVTADTPYEVELLSTTRYLGFSVVNAAALKDICIEQLARVKANTDILYMPIAAAPTNNPTTRTVTFTYVSDKDLDVRFSSSDLSASPEVLPKTAVGTFGQVEVTITSKATSEQEAKLTVQEQITSGSVADIKLEIPVETYRFPQKLPIQLEEGKDKSKRFYYVVTAYKDVEWDAANYAINLKKRTSAVDDNPYVTFAFDGAPSFISFVPLVDAENWKIEESQDGAVWGTCSGATLTEGVRKQTLLYTTHYVRVSYVGPNIVDVVKLTKLNILSDQSAIPNPEELNLTEKNQYTGDLSVGADLQVTTVNLPNMTIAVDNPNFTLLYGGEDPATTFILDESKIDNVFGANVVGTIPFKVFWNASKVSDFGNIIITTKIGEEVRTLTTIPLVGNAGSIGKDDELYTGVKEGYTLNGSFSGIYAIDGNDGTKHRKVNLSNTYDAAGNALFDILVIYGETTTTDGTKIITTPNGILGSNAKTPVFIYYREDNAYKFAMMEENANAANKVLPSFGVEENKTLRVYITGFAPYASTGYTKEDEGVWYFQGVNGAKLDIYLDDCYIYSRNKTPEGRPFNGRYDGQAFSENYVRGSGGVLVFENKDNDKSGSFDVTIHTINNNMFKSNYGCFFELMKGMRAFQVSSPIQVHLAGESHKANSVTAITFDDKWPTDATDYTKFKRTNGRLSLQKQHNNAPSIDLGNANTTVNFRGGQVELQNAAVVSNNYKTTLAISFRSGLMAGFPMAYGIGTDDVGGTVNFYDGTTTVIPMDVDVIYKDYYLLDVDSEGNAITKGDGDNITYQTSCLRCPTHTYVYGGSHCMMRACVDVTSKGGAPSRGGELLGIYKYPKIKATVEAGQTAPRGGFGDPDIVGLVVPDDVPAGYNVESVTPNNNGTINDPNDDYLNFWFTTEEESSVKPEEDKKINFWKACMTEISAKYMTYGGTVGGNTKILPDEDVKNLLYCQIDKNIHDVIYAGTGTGDDRVFTYQAPVKDPTGQLTTPYLMVPPTEVGEEWQNYIETVPTDYDPNSPSTSSDTGEDYKVTDKVYYVVPAQADVWMTFTAPFDVQKLWIVETYDENKLAETSPKDDGEGGLLSERRSILLEQAKHNADFAAFFAVAIALSRDLTFEQIYNDYIGWGKHVDGHTSGDYTKRGMIELEHYNGKDNFFTANYYLYKNEGDWELDEEKEMYTPQWKAVGNVAEGKTLMEQGETYSILLPYCTGCDVMTDGEGKVILDGNGLPVFTERTYWDYWTGKFLIFESTLKSASDPHVIKGSKYHKELFELAIGATPDRAMLTGNSTFALMDTKNFSEQDPYIWTYSDEVGREDFINATEENVETGTIEYQTIEPTVSFLITEAQSPQGMPARGITRDGRIIYGGDNSNGNQNGTSGGHIPTVGGGNDLFVTSIAGGINVAVAVPQNVRVLSSTGAVIYSGYIQTAVDIKLPTNGIYIVSGENEVQKILF